MADVFISYKAEEYNEANWVKTTLETNGITCWMAPSSIPGGSSYAVEIPQAIRAARVFVLILSEQSQLSKWVPRELDQAINEGKTILPFMLENCPLKDDFNFYLSNVQRYAAYENKAAAVEKMIREIKAILGVSLEDPAPAPAEEPAQPDEQEAEPAPAPPVNDPENEKKMAEKPKKEKKKADKPKKEKKKNKPEKEKKKDDKSKKPKKKRLLLLIPAALLVLIIIVAVIAGGGKKSETGTENPANDYVVIAGEQYSKYQEFITLKEKTLSADDIQKLSECVDLWSLKLESCTLPEGDISSLFSRAKSYTIDNCGLTDQQLSLVNFTSKEIFELILDHNSELTDLSALQPLADTLETLSFNGCSVIDFSFLKGFSQLTKLSAAGNGFFLMPSLTECPNLKVLDVSENRLSSLHSIVPLGNRTDLSNCKALEELYVGDNALNDLSGLETCIYLKKIYAQGNQIKSIDGLANTTLLTEVDLSGNQISDISLLAKSKDHLELVYLSGNAIGSLAPLSGAAALKELKADNTKLKSLDALSASSGLTVLHAAHNAISDLSCLANCTKLRDVDLSNNNVVNMSSLRLDASSSELFPLTVDLSHNKITSFKLPAGYYNLSLYGNPISDWKAVYSTKGGRLVLDYDSTIDFKALGASGSYHRYVIFDCPLDQQVRVKNAFSSFVNVDFTTEADYLKSLSDAA